MAYIYVKHRPTFLTWKQTWRIWLAITWWIFFQTLSGLVRGPLNWIWLGYWDLELPIREGRNCAWSRPCSRGVIKIHPGNLQLATIQVQVRIRGLRMLPQCFRVSRQAWILLAARMAWQKHGPKINENHVTAKVKAAWGKSMAERVGNGMKCDYKEYPYPVSYPEPGKSA